MKPKQKFDIDPELAQELNEAKEQLLGFFDRFGDIYYWALARKARAIAITAMLTNFLVSINAGFFAWVRPKSLSINFETAEWTAYFTMACAGYYLILTLLAHLSSLNGRSEKAILYWVLASLVFTLSLFSSFIGFFDSLTWFIFFLYTMLGFVLLDWRQVVVTNTGIIFMMIALSVNPQLFPFPLQAYLFANGHTLGDMSFLDLLSAWSITATSAFAGMWIMSFLLRNWHAQGMEHISQAHLDPLTMVLKRRAVLEALHDEVISAARDEQDLAVAVIDLDGFKAINTEHGHIFGDHLLRHFALLLKDITRSEDLVGRYGGQEFIVVFHGAQADVVNQILERFRLKLSIDALTDDTQKGVTLTFSAGISHLRVGDHKFENLIARADRALGEAKDQGGNKIICDGEDSI